LLGPHRPGLVTKLAQVARMKVVKRRDALGGPLAKDAVERSERLPCPLDSLSRDSVDLAVESHSNSPLPPTPRT
jgi:hypothetical protein